MLLVHPFCSVCFAPAMLGPDSRSALASFASCWRVGALFVRYISLIKCDQTIHHALVPWIDDMIDE